ncbi:inorganic phosphate transporter [Streptomyces sp. TR06-5]|uniref:inorganic phosphate transporter n=1 Tax=unclassified Streptomyces TaxID=2593676 RepID=UPI0039A0357E
MDTFALVVTIGVAFFFTYTNGFHDSANAIATSVSTRALTPRAALVMAAVMNLAGAFLGSGVAKTVSEGVIETPDGDSGGMAILFAALTGAIVWNLITWYFGLPSSSSHALIGGLAGAALAGGIAVYWTGVLWKIVVPMFLSPLVGMLLGYAVMLALLWLFRRTTPQRAKRGFRMAQTVSAAGMALGHGIQDAQKTMGVVVMALTIADVQDHNGIPLWVKISSALMLSLGTYAGGWRIMRTLGRRIIELDPPQGFAAEATASSVMYTASFLFNAPISTTHVTTSAIMGVGSTKRLSAVRWDVAKNIVTGWFVTMPAAAAVAALCYGLLALAG